VHDPAPGLTVEEIVETLRGGADVALAPGVAVSQLDHALQTAASLATTHADDAELAAAGLVHDIGHLLPGVGDEAHAAAGAGVVRAALGVRVAGLVALHVDAKRYLVATDPGYRDALAADSVASLAHQGGSLSGTEADAFRTRPLARAAVALRRADEGAKAEGRRVEGLDHWVPLLRKLSDGGGRPGR
jgi:predicted HD phosphohydrolase